MGRSCLSQRKEVPMTAPLQYELRKFRYTLVKEVSYLEPLTSVANLCLVEVLAKNEIWIDGTELMQRMVWYQKRLGQRHLEWLIEQPDELPEEFNNFFILFPGTIRADQNSIPHIPYLNCYGGDRSVGWIHLADKFYGAVRVAVASDESQKG